MNWLRWLLVTVGYYWLLIKSDGSVLLGKFDNLLGSFFKWHMLWFASELTLWSCNCQFRQDRLKQALYSRLWWTCQSNIKRRANKQNNLKNVWFSLLNQRKWSVHGACWNGSWEHVRWTQRPHAGYRWFTGSDPDNANATWALLTPSFPLPGGGCRLMFTR